MRSLVAALLLGLPLSAFAEDLDVRRFAVIERESGPTSYYSVIDAEGRSFIRAAYRPPLETVVVGVELSSQEKRAAGRLRWSWRVLAFPARGNACVPGKGDSPAAVYVSWKRGAHWYTLKYVWAADGAVAGTNCRRKRTLLSTQETVVLAVGGPLMTWRSEEIDLAQAFREHFGGDAPELMGIALMTDGDQTESVSAADYAEISLLP